MKKLEKITPWEQDFSKWYTDVIKNGDLIEYGPVKGTIMFKPNAYAIWENIQKHLSKVFKENNVKNVYLPLLIPESFIQKEKEHIEGFAPELATVTHVGDKKLTEQLYIRPTSEVLFADYFKKTIHSYNDLPQLLNQWTSVIRWEKTTNPFLRTSEFLWQEGHTAHSNALEARYFTRLMIKNYAKFIEKYLAIPVIMGKKTNREKFAGAYTTYTVEGMMKDGKSLQMGTSHYLAQKFSKNFDVTFKNNQNQEDYIYQTSWGISTRLIGALIMTHGDNNGLVLPPRIAPIQVDILEIFADKDPEVSKVSKEIYKKLNKFFSVRLDNSNKFPGFKASNSEIQGVPLRIEVGPNDLQKGIVKFVRRDTLEKIDVKIDDILIKTKELLKTIQSDMFDKAKKRLDDNIVKVDNYEDFKKSISENKIVLTLFEGTSEDEEKIQQETGATARCILIKCIKEGEKIKGECFMDKEKKSKRMTVFAKSY